MKSHSTSKTIALSLGVLTMSLLFSFVVLAWTEPDSLPPLGNVANLIKMSLGFAQIDESVNPSIWIKDTGGGDLIRLETEEGYKFIVENTGKIDMEGNIVSDLGLPLDIDDATNREFVINYVDAATTAEPVFTKCQVKLSSLVDRPNCPEGWQTLHTYSMAHINNGGIVNETATDNSWWYTLSDGTLSCAICQKISGETLKASGASCLSDLDCFSSICGTDADNDGYFNEAVGHTGICYAESRPYSDCYDQNNLAYPGQTEHYTTDRGDGSFDYNCDGSETKDPKYDCSHTLYSGCNGGSATSRHGGFSGSIPACGISQSGWVGWNIYRNNDPEEDNCDGSKFSYRSPDSSYCTSIGPNPSSKQDWEMANWSSSVVMSCR